MMMFYDLYNMIRNTLVVRTRERLKRDGKRRQLWVFLSTRPFLRTSTLLLPFPLSIYPSAFLFSQPPPDDVVLQVFRPYAPIGSQRSFGRHRCPIETRRRFVR
jgi:hypothetical protein